MHPTRWNVMKVAAYGALAGAAYAVIQEAIGGRGAAMAEYVGLMVGGAIGGALLFGVVALIRNAAAKT